MTPWVANRIASDGQGSLLVLADYTPHIGASQTHAVVGSVQSVCLAFALAMRDARTASSENDLVDAIRTMDVRSYGDGFLFF